MKKFTAAILVAFSISFSSVALAQEKDESKVENAIEESTKKVKKGAKKVGRKTAEVASKGKAKITDQEHKDKVGPGGETIYIDNHARYYWVDKKGKRHYVNEAELKNKEDE